MYALIALCKGLQALRPSDMNLLNKAHMQMELGEWLTDLIVNGVRQAASDVVRIFVSWLGFADLLFIVVESS